MNERRDDTTKAGDESRPPRGQGRYYYDDATGYETYRPGEEEPDEEDDPGREEDSGRRPGP